MVPFRQLIEAHLGREYHWGGPILPDWEQQGRARFHRQGVAIDVRPPDPETPPTTVIERPAIWSGGITPLFGHQVADLSTRLAPGLAARPDALVVVAVEERRRDEPLEGWMVELFEWFGVGSDRLHVVREPTTFADLLAATQGEQLPGIAPSERYLRLLDRHAARHPAPPASSGRVFVSRAGMVHRILGEQVLEDALSAAGYLVMRPESKTIRDQLDVYRSAEHLVFSEGSALHGLQLLGHVSADVTVIERRPGKHLAQRLVRPRVRSLRYLDHAAGLVHGSNPADTEAPWYGVTVFAEAGFVGLLADLGVPDPERWVPSFLDARGRDFERWLIDEAANDRMRTSTPAGLGFVGATLRAAGMDEWASIAEARLGGRPS